MNNFQELTTTKKGNLGEYIVDKYLLGKNIIPYIPHPDNNTAHPFDRLCASRDKKNVFIAEVKTKPSRNYYPDTGINLKAYDEYKFIQDKYKIEIWMFFVDENINKVYGNKLSKLDIPIEIIFKGKRINYPLTQQNNYGTKIIYFPIEYMIDICNIDDNISQELKNLSTRNYEYLNLDNTEK